MNKFIIFKPRSLLFDLLVLGAIGALISSLTLYISYCKGFLSEEVVIDLSWRALPLYTFYSCLRAFISFGISLLLTFLLGTWSAKSSLAEKVLLPLLDIGQSVPVLGFLPGAVLALVALFPNSLVGLELACILMILTGQVWNMIFSFYGSLKSIPGDMHDLAKVIGLTPWQKFKTIELPFAATNLAWNCVLSMAGGWFFLSICEAFTLSGRSYRLPGLGSYMSQAIDNDDLTAMLYGVLAMCCVILLLDKLLWQPLLTWVNRYRLDDSIPHPMPRPWCSYLYQESHLLPALIRLLGYLKPISDSLTCAIKKRINKPQKLPLFEAHFLKNLAKKGTLLVAIAAFAVLIPQLFKSLYSLLLLLFQLSTEQWLDLFKSMGASGLRVFFSLLLSSLWAIPLGIWVGVSPRRVNLFQPVAQLLASFPAPMLYPLVVMLLFALKIPFSWGSCLLMTLGSQWYVFFNVMAAATKLPAELGMACDLMNLSHSKKWVYFYLPGILPTLVTGWLTAAGGAWNACIVAECLSYKGKLITTQGIGFVINEAATSGSYPVLAAALCLIVFVVVLMNRLFWNRLYRFASSRFRFE